MTTRSVAVIGAGAAGLAAARELRREGHKVVIFEKSNQVGGIWVYTPESEPDPMSLDPTRKIIHTSLYASLRTNLPREVMGFREYPFTARPDSRDPRRFPAHREVMLYLQDYAREFGIEEMVRFEREVVKVRFTATNWEVRSRSCKEDDGSFDDERKEAAATAAAEVFDAVVVCNGHHSQPRIADFPGFDSWPGKQTHSHNYRTPEPFKNQVVVVIGNSFSGADLSIDVATVAKEVHIASRSVLDNHESQPQSGFSNIWIHPSVERACEDGRVVFKNGTTVCPETILHCTGYKYHFPFFKYQGIVTVQDNSVRPLYKHVFPPHLAPWLSFIGLTWKSLIFPMFELQSKWVSRVLSGRAPLPSPDEMVSDVNMFYSAIEASGVPTRYTHSLLDTSAISMDGDYAKWVAGQCDCEGFESWRLGMYSATARNRAVRPKTFRDEWEDDELVHQAHLDFAKLVERRNSGS
ncbi:Flavin-containing monooxygenase FMO GS-OX-like 3 [Linum perenne]